VSVRASFARQPDEVLPPRCGLFVRVGVPVADATAWRDSKPSARDKKRKAILLLPNRMRESLPDKWHGIHGRACDQRRLLSSRVLFTEPFLAPFVVPETEHF
jgi:hypothetical protein